MHINYNNHRSNTDTEKKESIIQSNTIVKDLAQNMDTFQHLFKDDATLTIRPFRNQIDKRVQCCVVFIDGMVNHETISENIIKPIITNSLLHNTLQGQLLDELIHHVIEVNKVKKQTDLQKMGEAIIQGDTILLIDGYDVGIVIHSRGWQTRALQEPESEKVVRGPREGFTESLLINLSLIRRKLKTPDLKIQFKHVGVRTNTKVSIIYLDNLVNKQILDEIITRLDEINIDAVLDSGYIQELMMDSPLSPMMTIGYTERPDVVAGKLLEGRIAIAVDGSPFVLTIPFLFVENFQNNEDYYNHFIWGSFNRLLRIIGAFFTISVPAMYIALVTFHQEMIPTPLLLSIVAARQGVPFPTIIEALGLILVFELLRETSVRMPSPIGQAVSILGALVLGQAAVEAKFVSAPMVIIVAITGITALINPKLSGACITIRFVFILLASFVGLYGYMFGLSGLLIHLFSMRSFGVPYMLNIGMLSPQDIKDTAIRAPWWYMDYRPALISAKNYVRQKVSKPRHGG